MDTPAQTKKASASVNKVVVAVAAIIIIALLAVVIFLLTRPSGTSAGDGAAPKLDYAAEATVMLDQDSLQAAFDEAVRNAAEGNIGLMYKNDAYSSNGADFECYIANSDSNKYDMFLTIFADAELTDQIYLSGLVAPGSGFENISLEHSLEPGDHTVYVALTQVDVNEAGEQVIKNQVMHTMDFHVTQ